MPTGPRGSKRPARPIASAVHVARIATGEADEQLAHAGKRADGRKGSDARAKKGAAVRWASA